MNRTLRYNFLTPKSLKYLAILAIINSLKAKLYILGQKKKLAGFWQISMCISEFLGKTFQAAQLTHESICYI